MRKGVRDQDTVGLCTYHRTICIVRDICSHSCVRCLQEGCLRASDGGQALTPPSRDTTAKWGRHAHKKRSARDEHTSRGGRWRWPVGATQEQERIVSVFRVRDEVRITSLVIARHNPPSSEWGAAFGNDAQGQGERKPLFRPRCKQFHASHANAF